MLTFAEKVSLSLGKLDVDVSKESVPVLGKTGW